MEQRVVVVTQSLSRTLTPFGSSINHGADRAEPAADCKCTLGALQKVRLGHIPQRRLKIEMKGEDT